MSYKLSNRDLKYPQIDAAFRYIYDNYNYYPELRNGILRDVVEFGVYKCGSLRKICGYLRSNFPYAYVHGVDSWEGLPNEIEGVDLFDKFTPGSYRAKKPHVEKLCKALKYDQLELISKPFCDLNEYDALTINSCMLIHIDCDLASSTEQALTWCFDNKLIGKHTLVAFDEYKTTDTVGGEQLGWYNIHERYDFSSEEVWFNKYKDKQTGQRITQSLWEITNVGEEICRIHSKTGNSPSV